MSFKAEEKTISKLLNDVIYEIPRNQRKYVWAKEDWKNLYDDVTFASENKKPHFLGSIVLKEESKINSLEHYTIIDGQQRVMTLTILFAAIMLHFKRQELIDDFNGSTKYIQSIDTKNKSRLIFETDYHKSLSKLTNRVLTIECNEAKSVSITSFINSCILDKRRDKVIGNCFEYFFSAINERIEQDTSKSAQDIISALRDAILSMSYVSITATTEEDSYTIFEILNARGQNLLPHELLKNFIMRYYEPIEGRDTAKNLWDDIESKLGKNMKDFIGHYAPHKYTSNKELRSEPYKLISKSTKDVKALVEDLCIKSEYYLSFIEPLREDDEKNKICSENEMKIFTFFKTKRISQFRPIMLSIINQKEVGNISSERYNEVFSFLLKFVTCYVFIGSERTNRFSDSIYKYAPIIENHYSDQNLQEFIDNLKSKIPNANWFKTLFQNIGYSKKGALHDSRQKEIVETVLELQEAHFRKSSNDIDFTIEHILPDSESEDNARIGNLLPLEEHLNRDCSNLCLAEKIEVYRNSSFVTVKNFVDRYGDNPSSFRVNSRTDAIASLFYNDILKLNILKQENEQDE